MRLIDADKYPCQSCNVSHCYKNCEKFVEWFNDTVDAVVFPCKPGDTVFVLWRLADPDICSECSDFHWGGMGDSHECGKTEDGFRSAECIEIQEWTANRDRILDWIRFDEFGRTVFSTHAEAEAALAKRRCAHA